MNYQHGFVRTPGTVTVTVSGDVKLSTGIQRVFDWIASGLGSIKLLKHVVQKALLLWDM